MSNTPYMDELSQGPWPSHSKELKRTRYPSLMYEEAMKEKYTQWGHGGMSHVPRSGFTAIYPPPIRPGLQRPLEML